jgi:hypothetical protein
MILVGLKWQLLHINVARIAGYHLRVAHIVVIFLDRSAIPAGVQLTTTILTGTAGGRPTPNVIGTKAIVRAVHCEITLETAERAATGFAMIVTVQATARRQSTSTDAVFVPGHVCRNLAICHEKIFNHSSKIRMAVRKLLELPVATSNPVLIPSGGWRERSQRISC